MAKTGAALGADLYRLHVMAKDNLPAVAAEYRAAAGSVAQTDSGLGAFTRSTPFNGPQGVARGAWVELRDTIERILKETDDNLMDTAEALTLAVEAYSASDYEAKRVLDDLRGRATN